MRIVIILTCFNRRLGTIRCIQSLCRQSTYIDKSFVVVDDGSGDNTPEYLRKFADDWSLDLTILNGDGKLYYSGGMRKGMNYVLHSDTYFDYVMLVNDDVDFYPNVFDVLLSESQHYRQAVIVGATCDEAGVQTYGGIRYEKNNSIKYQMVKVDELDLRCDTFNANCVLIPYGVFKNVDIIDEKFRHSLGDFDYGLQISKDGTGIYSTKHFIGKCNRNSVVNTWLDNTLPISRRLKLKEQVKGAPFAPWFYFLKKNWGVYKAITNSLTPYIRIFLRK